MDKTQMKKTNTKEEKSDTRYLWTAGLACNVSAMAVGMLITWSSPVLAKLKSEEYLDENPFGRIITDSEESWIGSLLALGAGFGPYLGGTLTDRIGRKFTLLLCAGIPTLICYLILSFGKIVVLFYVARLLGGIAIGSLFTALPMYFGEISEPAIRGAIGSSFNVLLVIGSLLSYVIGPYVTISVFSMICAAVPLAFLILFVFFPESPYYLVAKKKFSSAEKSLMKFRRKGKDGVEKELREIKESVEKDMQNKGNFFSIFKNKGLTKALLISIGLCTFQQTSGINVVLFYVTSIFQATGSSIDSDLSSIIVGTVQALASFATPIFVDRLGRKALLYISAVGMVISEALIGVYFFLKENKGSDSVSAIGWLPLLGIVTFIITYVVGFGPLPWTVMGEIFPADVKSVASMVTVSYCWFLAFLISKFYSNLTAAVGIGVTFWIFGGCCLVAVFFITFCVIETKGKTFQEIQDTLNK